MAEEVMKMDGGEMVRGSKIQRRSGLCAEAGENHWGW